MRPLRSRAATTVETNVDAVVTVAARRHGKSIDTSALRLRAAERCAVWLEVTDNLVVVAGATSPWVWAKRIAKSVSVRNIS